MRERCHIEQNHALYLAGQNPRLDSRANRDHLVGIHGLVGFLAAGKPPHQRLHGRDARRAADQDHLVDVWLRDFGVGKRLFHRPDAPPHQARREFVKLGAGDFHFEVLRSGGIRRDERQADTRLHHTGELDFGLFRRFGKTLQSLAVLAQVDSLIAQELIGHIVHQHFVKVVSAKVRVASRRADLEDAVADVQNRDVEGPAAEIEYQDGFALLLVEPVGERCRRRFVNDAQHVQPGDRAGVFGGLTLGIVKVRGDRDHGVGDFLAEVFGGIVHEAAQHLRRNLFGRVLLSHDQEAHCVVWAGHHFVRHVLDLGLHFRIAAANEALRRVNGVLGVEDGLPAGHLANQSLACCRVGDHRWCKAAAFIVDDDGGLATLHHRDYRIRSSQIDSYRFSHTASLIGEMQPGGLPVDFQGIVASEQSGSMECAHRLPRR